MSRTKEWEEEIIRRFPAIDRRGLPVITKFITILEEMEGFDKDANLQYNPLTHDIQIELGHDCKCLVYPLYNSPIQLRCIFNPKSYPFFIIDIQPTSDAIQVFLLTYWSELFPQDAKEKGE